MSDLIAIARNQRRLNLRTHYEGCEADHIECLVVKLADEVERLRAEGERLRAALQSIAKSTCCDRCNEAALVARKALEAGR
jgi:hypothetical protein